MGWGDKRSVATGVGVGRSVATGVGMGWGDKRSVATGVGVGRSVATGVGVGWEIGECGNWSRYGVGDRGMWQLEWEIGEWYGILRSYWYCLICLKHFPCV